MRKSYLVAFLMPALMYGCSSEQAPEASAEAPVAAEEVAVVSFDAPAAYAELVAANSEDAAAWVKLAVDAREAGDTAVAADAVNKAEALQVSPIRISIARARIAVIDGDPETAEAEIQSVADAGFTSVKFLTSDAQISTLAGRAKFDEIVAVMTLAAYPCENMEEFRAFDFWVGDWEVHGAGGQFAGTNSISAEERGCVLIERWENFGGGTGMSINYLDKESGDWVQIWNAEGGSQIDMRGGMTDEGMLLVGYMHTVGSATTQPFRGLWTLLDDGRVRQFFEVSSDDGETWQTSFEGFYTRVDKTAETE